MIRYFVVVAVIGYLTSAYADRPLDKNRPQAVKPVKTVLKRHHSKTEIIVKFKDDHEADLKSLANFGIRPEQIRPYFDRPQSDLEQERSELKAKQQHHLPQLSQYYQIHLESGSISAATLCDQINTLDNVELAYPASLPVENPTLRSLNFSRDIAPTTPSFTDYQTYFSSSGGVGFNDVQKVAGATGTGIQVADVEYSWVLDHEDIALPSSTIIDTAPPYDPFPSDQANHGTAVLGVLAGGKNSYGITGFGTSATVYLSPVMTTTYGYNVARAINLATGKLREGDIMLIEQQAYVCDTGSFGPVEWRLDVFDAISLATAKGIVVVEAGGNGYQNLDAPGCNGAFDRSLRDSGALIVGAGDPTTHAALAFSSYGSRVDVQGWGEQVTTTGYGTLFDPGDIRQRYTAYFNGTSSASAMVAGTLVSLQGIAVGMGFKPMKPDCMAQFLSQTGTPQGGDLNFHIGSLPNLKAAQFLMSDGGISCMERALVTRHGMRRGL